MPTFAVSKLLDETRRLAAEYKSKTGQTLPVSGELAKYDAAEILKLEVQNDPSLTYDLIGKTQWPNERIQVKSRVIFDDAKKNQRIGSFNLNGEWDRVLLVLYNNQYQPLEIYAVQKEALTKELSADTKSNKRGAMSVSKFRAISECVWLDKSPLGESQPPKS